MPTGLVDNGVHAACAFEGGAGPWTVDVRAYRRDDRVNIEVHNRGEPLPAVVGTWLNARDSEEAAAFAADEKKSGLPLVARVAEAFQGTLSGHSAAEMTIMTLSFPAVASLNPEEAGDEQAPTSQRSAQA